MIKLSENISAIIVTYGARWNLLKKVLDAAKNNGVSVVYLIDNGSIEKISELASLEFGDFVLCRRLSRNIGSAGGFKIGLEWAINSGAELILMLDDDNVMQEKCVAKLVAQYNIGLIDNKDVTNFVVIGYRDDHLPQLISNSDKKNNGENFFLGFNFLDVPRKIYKKIKKITNEKNKLNFTGIIKVKTAPWSGMLFHKSVVIRHGLPDDRFVLYCDDTEYTHRITSSGGEIQMCVDANIEDIDKSWSLKSKYGNSFDSFLKGEGDFRAYYSIRNQSYFMSHCCENGFMYKINKVIYLTLLFVWALMIGRMSRWSLIFQAVRDGENSKLGICNRFPL